MGWHEVMEELEWKLGGILRGEYRPRDGIPFFRVQYPPQEERKALSEFHLLSERLKQHSWQVGCLSLTDVLRETLADMLNCPLDALHERLRKLEQERDREELQMALWGHLPERVAEKLVEKLTPFPQNSIVILLRTGALYPFVRPSALLARLENRVNCIIVLAYPSTTVGELLDTVPTSLHGGYYRGEVIYWREGG